MKLYVREAILSSRYELYRDPELGSLNDLKTTSMASIDYGQGRCDDRSKQA